MNWNWDLLLPTRNNNHNGKHHHDHHNHDYEATSWTSLGDAWTGDYYYAFFYATALYFIVDFIWVLTVPHCVRSPSVILQHHAATLLYIWIPNQIPHVRWCMVRIAYNFFFAIFDCNVCCFSFFHSLILIWLVSFIIPMPFVLFDWFVYSLANPYPSNQPTTTIYEPTTKFKHYY